MFHFHCDNVEYGRSTPLGTVSGQSRLLNLIALTRKAKGTAIVTVEMQIALNLEENER
jgi:hypothetical protein